jgi:hypothetical protein
MTAVKRSRFHEPTHRIIASRYIVTGAFDDLTADKNDIRAAFLLEALTNDRLAAWRVGMLPDEEIVTGSPGSGATLVMAAFLHANQQGGRFTDGRLGAWYAAFELETAIAETIYHNTRRLRLSDGGFPNRIEVRQLTADIDTDLVDVQELENERPELYQDNDYSGSQTFASSLRWPETGTPEDGIVYDSVRHRGGTNICVFWPRKVLFPVIQGDHFAYHWTAQGDVSVVKLTDVPI